MSSFRLLISQVLLGVVAIAAIAGGIYFIVGQSGSNGGIEIILPTPTPTAVPVTVLKVHISGAVRNPGLYAVNEGDRLADVIEAAGGATEDADLEAVNLAVRVKDQDHWHIPRLGETAHTTPTEGSSAPGKINLNTASADQLERLPGIWEVKAQSIIRYRETNGPFSSVDELLNVSGIGAATLDAIRDLVEVR